MTPNMMPPRGPQGPQGPQAQRQLKYSLKDTKSAACSCGHEVFTEGFLLRTLSRIITGEDRDTLITVPIVVCAKCGLPYQEMLPAELKTSKVSV